jgi:cytochrome c-type biogenesis protein
LAVPFLITSLAIERFLLFYRRFQKYMHVLEVGSGGLLIALGILLVLGRFSILSGYLSFLNKFAL